MPRIYQATFQPFTYEELATPLREATAAHQAQEEKFDTLMTDADKMRAFLKEDWQSYKDYKEYVDNLNTAAEDLARNGLTRQNRNNLLQLKRDYNGKIQAINAGILSRQNAIDTFNKSAKGQSSRYIGARPEDYSVDEYMYGNNPFKLGVDGSEIYGYADEQAKASTSRRYQEFTEGGKWRITEVGVDPYTTQIVMDALRTGQNIAGDPRFASNPRQAAYMQAVLNDMRDISNNARETFGYGQFVKFDDNGNPVQTPNQMKFDSEIFGGLNKGIQYSRKSEADPYALAAYKEALDIETYRQKAAIDAALKGQKDGTENDFGLLPIDFTNPDVIKAQNVLGLKKNENGQYETQGKTIEYNGKKIHFDSKLDAYKWANQDQNVAKLEKEESKLHHKYGISGLSPVSGIGVLGFVLNNLRSIIRGEEYYSFGDLLNDLSDVNLVNAVRSIEDNGVSFSNFKKMVKEDYDKLTEIKKQYKEYDKRSDILKQNNYYLSKGDYRDISKAYGFNPEEEYSVDDLVKLTNLSLSNTGASRIMTINVAPNSGRSFNSEGKTTYTDDAILKKIKGTAAEALNRRNQGTRKISVYDISPNNLQASTAKRNSADVDKIISNATSVYTTLELFMHEDGINEGTYTPIIVFQDANGEKVGISMENLGPEYENLAKIYQEALKDEYGYMTNQNRSHVENKIAEGLYNIGQKYK